MAYIKPLRLIKPEGFCYLRNLCNSMPDTIMA